MNRINRTRRVSVAAVSSVESLEGRRLLATLFVNSLADSGTGSLRQAVDDANASDTIDLTGVSGTIALSSTITINESLTITGPGADELTVDGNDTFRLFEQYSGDVSLSGVTLQDGSHGNTGGAWSTSGMSTNSTSFDGVVFESNRSDNVGGAVFVNSDTDLTITNSTFHDNYAGNVGAAVGFVGTTLTFANNTVYGNNAGNIGAGLFLYSGNGTSDIRNSTFANNGEYPILLADGSATITNCTVTGNAGGIQTTAMGGMMTLTNSIVWGNNIGNGDYDVLWYEDFTSGGNNIIGAENEGWSSTPAFNYGVNGDLPGVDPKLNTLADNGGPTQTISLQFDSPAINAGDDTDAPTDDQRGYGRTGASDIGAFEYNGVDPTLPPNNAPVWTTTSLNSAALGVPYSMTIAFTDADNGDTLNVALGGFPDSFSFEDHADGTATITGIAQMNDVGTHNVTLMAGDGTDTVDLNLSFYIGAPVGYLSNGTLYINGTDVADDIDVWIRDDKVRMTRGTKILDFPLANVSEVKVIGYGDNDNIAMNVRSIPTQIDGGAGNDTLIGAAGNDRLYGDSGNDYIDAGAGRNWAWGGDGNDTIIGGNSIDRFYGGTGNDLFVSRGKSDFIDGGDDTDTALDALDARIAVEVLA